MSALITNQIPEQNFELITKQLGVILFLELNNQNDLLPLDDKYDIGLFLERQNKIDSSEDVVVNVSYNSSQFSNQNEKSSQSDSTFNIDVYVNGVYSGLMNGDEDSRLKHHKVVGWIRYILSSTVYRSLGLPFGIIMSTDVQSINFDDNYGNEDGNFIRMCRIVFSVRHIEDCELESGVALLGHDSTIKLDLTNKGYKFNFNND